MKTFGILLGAVCLFVLSMEMAPSAAPRIGREFETFSDPSSLDQVPLDVVFPGAERLCIVPEYSDARRFLGEYDVVWPTSRWVGELEYSLVLISDQNREISALDVTSQTQQDLIGAHMQNSQRGCFEIESFQLSVSEHRFPSGELYFQLEVTRL